MTSRRIEVDRLDDDFLGIEHAIDDDAETWCQPDLGDNDKAFLALAAFFCSSSTSSPSHVGSSDRNQAAAAGRASAKPAFS